MEFLSRTNLTLAGIIIIGAILRFYNLASMALWHDEAFSALLIRYPFWEMIDRIALDVHPPLYYLILRLWDFALGDSLFSLRFFSAFWGILVIPFAYLFIKTAFKNERLALISAALIAINPFQIQYATEARMYTLGTFLIVFSSWLLIKAMEFTPLEIKSDNKDKLYSASSQKVKLAILFGNFLSGSKQYKWWLFYGVAASAAIYTHYYLIFSVAAQAIFIAFTIVKKYKSNFTPVPLGNQVSKFKFDTNLKGALIAYATAFIIYLPWLSIFLKQLGQVEQNYWIPKMTASSVSGTLWKMFAGSNIEVGNLTLALITVIFLFILYIAVKRRENDNNWLVVFSFAVPFVLAIIFSFKRSLYLDRYFVFSGLFYLIIFALFIEAVKSKFVKSGALIILTVLSLFLFIQNWKVINPANKPGMKAASMYIFQNAKSGERVFAASSFIFFTYKYYAYQNYFYGADYPADFNPGIMKSENNIIEGYRIYPEYLTPLLYTSGVTNLKQLPHFSGTALLNNNDLLNDFSRDTKRGDIIWLLWTTGFGGSKPEVPENWKQSEEAGFQDVFGYRGWIVATKYQTL